ncbi:ABC transporter transmembrane domain-containing protein [Enterovirga sp.]|uniref:ABC transporter transmembrane domain-containing protein n=1 Tax=Enterovirga sp. TaxID=2026350 RepID=UPI00261D94A2|nr:ABC transporter transmembrane domain-containing protein [Enterovirga sp.]MDB5592075.1 transporter [Enterovirga sp.]
MPALSPDRSRASLRSLKPLVPFGLRYKGRIAAALCALVVASAATLALPVSARRVIDHGFSEGSGRLIDAYFGVLIGVVAAIAVASALRAYLVGTLGERIVADLRAAVFRRLTTLDPAFFDAARSGELVSRLTADTTQVKSAFGVSISMALRNVALFVGALVMMIVTSPKLSGLVILAIPLIVLPLVFSGRAVQRRSRASQDRLADASAYAAEAVGAVRTMQAFGMEAATAARFAAEAEAAYRAARDAARARAFLTGAVIFLVSASVVGVLWYGAQDVLSGHMSGGRLSQFVLYAVFAASSLGQLSEVYGELSAAAGSAERLGEILASEPLVARPALPQTLPEPPLGTVAFEAVSFRYPARDTPSLRGISFSVGAGERVALVGPSGAGKSTVFQLLLRFFDPETGRVLVDGVPIRELDPAALRSRMALVPQEPTVFRGSVLDNIRYGRPEASEPEIRRAAEVAAAHGFISALPHGYATEIGERGVTLSGGQRQRIAIARAVLKDSPILLLDEATSALDAESEQAVQAALERLMSGRTSLVVAHRLATVRSADRILVLDDGAIVEEGTHEALSRRGGLYARLAALQFGEAVVPSSDAAG